MCAKAGARSRGARGRLCRGRRSRRAGRGRDRVDRAPPRHAGARPGEHGRDQHRARGVDARVVRPGDADPRSGGVLESVGPTRGGAARASAPCRGRHLTFRCSGQQGGRQHERLPPVLGRRRVDVGHGAPHRVVRQPAEVHPNRATGLEDEADRRGEDGRRRRRSHRGRAVPSDGCDPRGRDRRALRRGARARQPAAATGRSRRGDQQRLRGEVARGGGADALRSAHGRAQRRHTRPSVARAADGRVDDEPD